MIRDALFWNAIWSHMNDPLLWIAVWQLPPTEQVVNVHWASGLAVEFFNGSS